MSKPVTQLKAIRESKFMTLADLHKASRVAIGTISKAENGGRISFSSIKNLARALGISPDRLL